MKTKLAGVFAPITTPFVNEEVSLKKFKSNIQKYNKTPLAGIFVLGSNGESKSLTESEKISLLEVVLAERGDHQMVMAGTGYESTRQTISFSKKVAGMGVDCVSVVTPSYFKKQMTDDALIAMYTEVAEALTVPVIIYNAPGFTGVTVSPKVVKALASHPNIAGMKDSSTGNMSSYLLAAQGADFNVLAGTVSTLLPSMMLGATGGVVSLANAFPASSCDLYDRHLAGDAAAALKLHNTLYVLNQSVSGSFGVAGVKYAMELGGFHGGDPRKPLLSLKEKDKESIRAAAKAAGMI
ncbi:MAG: dihydrodipicolinate synthase family protein [Desulfobacterales bacterium]|nr:dihydrodipicolinate synthase family protein [Desulfobacterales bacterium]